MGRFLTLTRSNVIKPGLKQKTYTPAFSIGPISLKFVLITFLCVLGLFYISQSNQASVSGYKIREFEERKNKLILENQRLKVEVARLKSLGAIQNTEDLDLVPPTKIDYLPAESPVAVEK